MPVQNRKRGLLGTIAAPYTGTRRFIQNRLSSTFNLNVSNGVFNTVAIVTAAAAIGAAVWFALPGREDVLRDWDKDYKSLCYSPDKESKFYQTYSSAGSSLRESYRYLEETGHIGFSAKARHKEDDAVFCFGKPYVEDEDKPQGTPFYHSWWHDLYIIDRNMTEEDVAKRFFTAESNEFADDAARYTEEYITSAVVIWSRAQQAAAVVQKLEGTYDIYSSTYEGDVFNESEWQKYESASRYASAAAAFKAVLQDNENDLKGAKKAAFRAALLDPAVTNKSDISTLSYYEDDVDEESYQDCSGTGKNRSCTTRYRDPAYWVHSSNIAPQTLVELSAVFSTHAKPYLSLQDAQDIINDPATVQLHSERAQSYYNRAVRNAKWHCVGHYDGKTAKINLGLTLTREDLKPKLGL